MNKGAIFDVDGTLLDSMPIWDDASERFLTGLGVKAEPGLSDIMFRMSLDEGAAYLKSAYGLDLSEQEIKDGILGVIRDFYFYQAQLKPGAGEFLAQMKAREIPMYIATSSNREHIRAAFERLGVYNYFDGLITCEEAGAGKSDPRIFLLAADRMGLEPADIFVFEDVIHAIVPTIPRFGRRADSTSILLRTGRDFGTSRFTRRNDRDEHQIPKRQKGHKKGALLNAAPFVNDFILLS